MRGSANHDNTGETDETAPHTVTRRAAIRTAALTGGGVFSGLALSAGFGSAFTLATPIGASAAAAATVTGWGGCDLVRSVAGDQLTVEVAATGEGVIEISGLTTGGKTYTVVGPALLRSADGRHLVFRSTGAFDYDLTRRVLTLRADGSKGTLKTIGARFDPPAGEAFVPVKLEVAGTAGFQVYAPARGFRSPDHKAQLAYAPAALAALRKLSDHFDQRRTPNKGWRFSASIGPDGEDPQGISTLASGYLQLHRLTGEAGWKERSIAAFDWLANNQQPAGGYGFPWRWGRDNGHRDVPEHFANGNDHPAGTPYAVNVINVGRILLVGYETYKDPKYLAAARRVRDYLLTSPTGGFQWLDNEKTRGSFPYCTLTPVLPPDHPLVAKHNDVLPRLQNTSVEFYNVDAFGVRFFEHFRKISGDTKLRRYEQALLKNLRYRQQESGTIAYSWTEPNHPDYYTYAVAAAFLMYGGDQPFSQIHADGRRMMTWRDNAYHPSLVIAEAEVIKPMRLDNTRVAVNYLESTLKAQKPDGSWTGGKESRGDADKLNSLSMMMVQAGYQA